MITINQDVVNIFPMWRVKMSKAKADIIPVEDIKIVQDEQYEYALSQLDGFILEHYIILDGE